MTRPRIGIIGGGITGLTTAYRLVQAGCDVTLFEASSDVGGLASGFTLAGFPVEKAYHFLYKTDRYILGLVDELGLGDKLKFFPSSVSTYYDGVLYPMMTPVDLIRFTPISFIDRIRAGLTVLWLQRVRNWRKLSSVTALDWLRRWAGRGVADVIWEPLLRGKFDRFYDKVTMSWLWGRVKQRVDSRDAKVGGEALGYFDGGFKVIIDALMQRLHGADIRLNTRISGLRHDGAHVVVTTSAGEERFDRVLATVPSNVFASLISTYENEDPAYFQRLRSIDYLDACVHVFATPQQFTRFYWHNINTPNAPFVVFLSLTNLVGSEKFGGLNVYYIGDYVPSEHEYMSMDAGELKRRWYAELQKIFPEFDPALVVDDGLFRLRHAQHIVDIGFETGKLLPHDTPCPGVFLCNFSQIYPMDRGTNYSVRDGDRMAELLMASLEGREGDKTAPLLTEEGGLGDGRPARSGARSGVRKAAALVLAAIVLMGAAGAGYLGGFETAVRELPGHGFMTRVDGKLGAMLGLDESPPIEPSITTVLLTLRTDIGDLSRGHFDPLLNGERGYGGAVTSFGGDVLVLPFSGRIYAASSGSDIRETAIQAPLTNRAEYLAAAERLSPEGYEFDRIILRYNDIAYYNTGASHGLLVSYIEYHADRACFSNTLARLEFAASVRSAAEVSATPADWAVVHRTAPCLPLKRRYLALEGHMAGGRLEFASPTRAYWTSGDFHLDGMRSEGPAIAQDPEAEYGKVLSVDIMTGRTSIVSMGHRNAQGIALHGGDVYVLEHGPRGGDELNRLRQGANYGWPRESYGTTYRQLNIPNSDSYGRHDAFEAPAFSWIPSPALSSLTRIEGFHDAWNGDLLAGSLLGQQLFRIRIQGDHVVYAEPIPIGARIRDVHQHTDGRLVLWTDDYRLVFVSPGEDQGEQQFVQNYISELRPRLRDRVNTAVDACSQCHSFVAGDDAGAPSLARVFGANIGSTDFPNYSPALRARGGRWTREALARFLDDPQQFAPGTTMPDPHIEDPEVRDAVVRLLERMEHSF